MPEVKSTTPGKQLATAVSSITAALEEAKRQLDERAAAMIRQLEEAAAARTVLEHGAGGALIDRMHHVFVAHFDPRGMGHLSRFFDSMELHSPIANYRINLTPNHFYNNGPSILSPPRDCAYRVWVLFEPIAEEKKGRSTAQARGGDD